MPLDNRDEIFQVVDENDNPIGTATRRECHSNPNLIHRGIYVILSDGKGRVLLQKRSMKKDMNPGVWGVSAGGHCSVGETYEQTAKRETKEELGISVKLKLIGKLLLRKGHESEFDAIFIGKIQNLPRRLDKDEVDDVRFFSLKELKKLKKSEVVPSFWDVMNHYFVNDIASGRSDAIGKTLSNKK